MQIDLQIKRLASSDTLKDERDEKGKEQMSSNRRLFKTSLPQVTNKGFQSANSKCSRVRN